MMSINQHLERDGQRWPTSKDTPRPIRTRELVTVALSQRDKCLVSLTGNIRSAKGVICDKTIPKGKSLRQDQE